MPQKSVGKCSRGARSGNINTAQIRLENDEPRVETFIRSLAGACYAAHLDRSERVTRYFVQELNDALPGFEPTALEDSEPPISLGAGAPASPLDRLKQQGTNYADRCSNLANGSEFLVYRKFVAMVEMAVWQCRISQATNKAISVKEAYKLLSPPNITFGTFSHWLNAGYTLLRLMYATSVHVLSAISVATMCTLVDRVLVDDRIKIENLLRNPHSSQSLPATLRSLISMDVVRYHRHMLSTFRDGVQIAGRTYGVQLAKDDTIIKDLCMAGYPAHEHNLLKRTSMWSFELSPNPSLPAALPVPDSSEVVYIATDFNPDLAVNKVIPQELETNPKEWTQKQRVLAEAGERPESIKEMTSLFQSHHQTGSSGGHGYIWVSPPLVATHDILVHGTGDPQKSLLFFRGSSNTISDELKDVSLARIKDIINLQDETVDTAAEGDDYEFKAVHAGFWNKFGINGEGVDPDFDPRQLLVDMVQSQPYHDRALISLSDDHNPNHFYQCPREDLNDTLWELLQPVLTKLQTYLPDLMAKHEDLYSSLGPSYHLGSAPFCMTVINIQPVTRGHCDTSDMVDSICVVLALGHFTGGALCLYETKAVLPLQHGEFAAIPSKRDVHFNLHFSGQRLSLVFTSDQSIKHWRDRRNGWVDLQRIEPST
ncbi:hypothetical protein FS749_010003 [Ceratobasidium sp. UAMH 11750]|nr:hypothetical protein FS749_010003 [Ceratobasidium sp. UAMH 11750]